MKEIFKGLKVVVALILFFVGAPTGVGYLVVKLNWPESLIEWGFSLGYNDFTTYGHIGFTFLLLPAAIIIFITYLKILGKNE